MVWGRKLAIHIVPALILALTVVQPAYASKEGVQAYDCNMLYELLLNSIKMVKEGRADPETLLAIANATVPENLAPLHREVYRLLAGLAHVEKLLANHSITRTEYLQALAELYEVKARFFDTVGRYTGALYCCSHDRTLATILGMRVRSEAKQVDEQLVYDLERRLILLAYAGEQGNVRLQVEPTLVTIDANTLTICATGLPADGDYRVTVVVTPGHAPLNVTVARALMSEVKPGRYCANLALEPLSPSTLGIHYPSRVKLVPYWLTVRIESVNGTVYGSQTARIMVEYRSPVTLLTVPDEVAYGSPLTLQVKTLVPVNVTVEIDGAMTISKVVNGFDALEVDTGNLTAGLHTVRVYARPIEGSGWYAPVYYSKGFAVTAPIPRVTVIVPNPVVDPANTVTVIVRNLEGTPLLVTISLGSSRHTVTVYNETRLQLHAPPNPLPWVYRVTVNVSLPGSRLSMLVASREIIVVNPLGLLAAAIIPLIVSLVRSDVDLLALVAATLGRGGGGEQTLVPQIVEEYFEALRLRVRRSRLAQAYYQLLDRLGIPRPKPPQTLREHWREAIAGLDEADMLWEKMVEAERDLYSLRKAEGGGLEGSEPTAAEE